MADHPAIPGGKTSADRRRVAASSRLRRPPLVLTAIVAVLVLGPGCTKQEAPEVAPTVTVQVATAEIRKLERQINADAVIFPLRQAAIVPKINAPVHKFYVERGSHVRAGELLVQLENQDLLAAKTDAKGAYNQAEAAYETATRQSLPEEVQKAQLDTKAAQSVMETAQKNYDSLQKLYQQGATARKNVEDADVAYIQARNQYEIALRHLESFQKLGKDAELKSAQGQLASARGKVRRGPSATGL